MFTTFKKAFRIMLKLPSKIYLEAYYILHLKNIIIIVKITIKLNYKLLIIWMMDQKFLYALKLMNKKLEEKLVDYFMFLNLE